VGRWEEGAGREGRICVIGLGDGRPCQAAKLSEVALLRYHSLRSRPICPEICFCITKSFVGRLGMAPLALPVVVFRQSLWTNVHVLVTVLVCVTNFSQFNRFLISKIKRNFIRLDRLSIESPKSLTSDWS